MGPVSGAPPRAARDIDSSCHGAPPPPRLPPPRLPLWFSQCVWVTGRRFPHLNACQARAAVSRGPWSANGRVSGAPRPRLEYIDSSCHAAPPPPRLPLWSPQCVWVTGRRFPHLNSCQGARGSRGRKPWTVVSKWGRFRARPRARLECIDSSCHGAPPPPRLPLWSPQCVWVTGRRFPHLNSCQGARGSRRKPWTVVRKMGPVSGAPPRAARVHR